MKRLFFLMLAIMLTTSQVFAAANVFGTRSTVTVAGRVFSDLDNLKTLHCYVSVANKDCSYRDMADITNVRATGEGAAGYLPVAGKQFRVLAMKVIPLDTTVAGNYGILLSPNDVGWDSTDGSYAPVVNFPNPETQQHLGTISANIGGSNEIDFGAGMVPSSTGYMGVIDGLPGMFYIYGQEEDL